MLRYLDWEFDVQEPEYETEEGICPHCGEECTIMGIDVGIGPYEFWGHRGRDVQIVAASDCCEAEM